ncbi:hypothetical protein QU755_19185, partial [Pseudomonas wenzhouensis]
MIEALFCGAIPIVGHHRLLPFTMAAAVGQSCSHTPSLLCVALAEDITRPWRQNINPAIKYTKSCCVGDTWMPEIRTDS